MKYFLLTFCICLSMSGLSQETKQGENYFLGKWKAVDDSTSSRSFFIVFIDMENLEMTLESIKFHTKYKIETAKDSSILILLNNKTGSKKMVLIPDGENKFYFNTFEDHQRYLIAKNAKPGQLAWGWTNPTPIKFERQ